MSRITTTMLDCGMPLIVEKIPGVRSCGVMWLLPSGSARDPEDRQGLSAMLAEMLMRGAGELDSRGQADAFDALGASRGTGVETFHLSLSATLLGSRLKDALPLLVDMVRRPRFEEEAVEPSRDLCMQAVASLKDDPSERLMVSLKLRHAPAPINRSALGTMDGLEMVNAAELAPSWATRGVPGGSVLAMAGDVDASAVAGQLNALLDGWKGKAAEVVWGGKPSRGYLHEEDATNQTHIAVAYDAPAESEKGCWEERVATAVLSGGMSGRLFTEVREKRGLCYSVYASYASDAKFGRTVAYVGTTPEKAQQSLDVLLGELQRVRQSAGAVSKDEFDRAVIGLKSKLVMSGESSGARANALARDWWKLGRPRSLEELKQTVEGLTADGVNHYLASRSGLGSVTIASIGPAALVAPR